MAPESPGINRKGFGLKKEVQPALEQDYGSAIVSLFLRNNYVISAGDLTLLLAREFGFCYGVERAIDYAYQTRQRFPDRRIFLLGQIVHNPFVNRQLEQMGITILDGLAQDELNFGFLRPEDVVILPAFGAKVSTLSRLEEMGCIVVDTTCGSVISVWKRVERYAREGFTTVIHGKFHHEETQATCSHVTRFPNAHFLVVLDRREAEWVAEAIRGRMPGKELMARLGKHGSPGFDPEVHLQKIGLANQTTMLSSESLEIAEILRRAILDRYGEEEVNRRFLSFDTICSATQDRQDAVAELIREHQPDLMLVIGGFNSSNTAHLAEIAAREVPAYHIEDASCLDSQQIRYRDPFTGEIRHSQGWLPEAPVRIGLTSGASTPNSKLAEVVERLFALKGMKGELQRLMENASG